MIQIALWLGVGLLLAWGIYRLVGLGREAESGDAAQDELDAIDRANKIREDVRNDKRDPRNRLRDKYRR